MKKLLLIQALLFQVISSSLAQDSTDIIRPMTSQDYLKKARAQKTTGFILLGITGGIVAISAKGNIDLDILSVLAGVGVASGITSIFEFAASGRNKRKAELMLKKEKVFLGLPNSEKYITGISFVIPLGNMRSKN